VIATIGEMSNSQSRSLLATVVGWLIVVLVVWFLFGWIVGAGRALVRFASVLVVIGVLAVIWFRLRADD
jgi:preprotein translocase subunit SecF